MPEHLRALVVILALSAGVFLFAKAPATALAMAPKDFERRRNLWFAITLTAFLAHNFWLYIVVAAGLLLVAVRNEHNKLAMFFFLLFAVPPLGEQITGLGLIKHFFTIDYIRLLTLAVLLPAFLSIRTRLDTERFGRSIPDKLISSYIVLNFLLMFTASTFTNTLRHGVFYAFVDIFLPYYIASRSVKNLQDFRDTLMAFAVAALVLSAIGAFEFARHWLLYAPVGNALGIRWEVGNYLDRADTLRAQGSTGHPIVLGYVMAVAIGFLGFLRKAVPNKMAWSIAMAVLLMGLVASLSRGPWMGAAVMLLLFIALGPAAGLRFAVVGVIAVIMTPFLLASSTGEKIIDLLPFLGTVEAENITYRRRLLEISIQVIMQNPLFGAFDYIYSPAMQELRQGQGIIDIVNSYLGVGLTSGLVGLSIFLGFFISVAVGVFKAVRKLIDKDRESYLLGQALLSTLLGILVVIATASSTLVIPVVYWSVAGLCIAYARVVQRTVEGKKVSEAPRENLGRSPAEMAV